MKQLHKESLYCWSCFDEARNIDFHSYLWRRSDGNIVFDPLPLSEHDAEHLDNLGGVSLILITNSDHVRDAEALAHRSGAPIWGPEGERDQFPVSCARWLGNNEQPFDDLEVYALEGSKTEGELAFLLERDTLLTGDLIRSHRAGSLCLLPDAKLADKKRAVQSVSRLSSVHGIQAVLPGDGWPVFRDAAQVLLELVHSITREH